MNDDVQGINPMKGTKETNIGNRGKVTAVWNPVVRLKIVFFLSMASMDVRHSSGLLIWAMAQNPSQLSACLEL